MISQRMEKKEVSFIMVYCILNDYLITVFYESRDATSKLANIFTCINIASAAPSMTFDNWINRFRK